MRQVVLDTETTGLYPADGDRIISIGCVEIVDRRITGREYHTRLNPEGRKSHEKALEVHKIADEDLVNEPTFAVAKDELAQFLRGAQSLIIHNAPFDIGFLNAELARIGSPVKVERRFEIIDTMRIAGQAVGGSLNRMLDQYGIDRSVRAERHGALIDSRLLAQLYLAMTRGNEELEIAQPEVVDASEAFVRPRVTIPVVRATAAELEAHEAMMDRIKGAA